MEMVVSELDFKGSGAEMLREEKDRSLSPTFVACK